MKACNICLSETEFAQLIITNYIHFPVNDNFILYG